LIRLDLTADTETCLKITDELLMEKIVDFKFIDAENFEIFESFKNIQKLLQNNLTFHHPKTCKSHQTVDKYFIYHFQFPHNIKFQFPFYLIEKFMMNYKKI